MFAGNSRKIQQVRWDSQHVFPAPGEAAEARWTSKEPMRPPAGYVWWAKCQRFLGSVFMEWNGIWNVLSVPTLMEYYGIPVDDGSFHE